MFPYSSLLFDILMVEPFKYFHFQLEYQPLRRNSLNTLLHRIKRDHQEREQVKYKQTMRFLIIPWIHHWDWVNWIASEGIPFLLLTHMLQNTCFSLQIGLRRRSSICFDYKRDFKWDELNRHADPYVAVSNIMAHSEHGTFDCNLYFSGPMCHVNMHFSKPLAHMLGKYAPIGLVAGKVIFCQHKSLWHLFVLTHFMTSVHDE